jgi:hypothetical protein
LKQKLKHKTSSKDPSEETFEQKKERYETPYEDYDWLESLVRKLRLPIPSLDIMASKYNTKCIHYLDELYDATQNDFVILAKGRRKRLRIPNSVFLNAPHKKYQFMVPQCESQWQKYGFTIVALIPSRNERTKYWRKVIEPNRFEVVNNGHIFYFPLDKRFIFEIDGEQAHAEHSDEIQHDPNGYKLVIWIGKDYLKDFKKNLKRFYQWYYVDALKQKAKKRSK